jgi:hypothetical protein
MLIMLRAIPLQSSLKGLISADAPAHGLVTCEPAVQARSNLYPHTHLSRLTNRSRVFKEARPALWTRHPLLALYHIMGQYRDKPTNGLSDTSSEEAVRLCLYTTYKCRPVRPGGNGRCFVASPNAAMCGAHDRVACSRAQPP